MTIYPATDKWVYGDVVRYIARGPEYGVRGVVTVPPCDPAAHEQAWPWVNWSDGKGSFTDPLLLDRA